MNIVTIMNYKHEPATEQMCYIWIDRVLKHSPADSKIYILYESNRPRVPDVFNNDRIIVEQRKRSEKYKHKAHNLRFKLFNLANMGLDEFMFLDADMYVIADLKPLWDLRKDKPWVGTNHQWVPRHGDTHRPPFLNSGLQIVSDPSIYKYEKIMQQYGKGRRIPGWDQHALYNYFEHIKYDYTHPKVGTEWNSCAKVGTFKNLGDKNWTGHTKGLIKRGGDHPIYINHYWAGYKPWKIDCPIHKSYNEEFKEKCQF